VDAGSLICVMSAWDRKNSSRCGVEDEVTVIDWNTAQRNTLTSPYTRLGTKNMEIRASTDHLRQKSRLFKTVAFT
jgi:hypothetical protein